MLNQDRIRLMTQLAAYEQSEGKKNMSVSRYYRKDYVAVQMIKTFVYSTIAFGILFLLSILYDLEKWLESLYQIEWREYIGTILLYYVIFVVAYQVMAWAVYTIRYKNCQKQQKLYGNKLKKVVKLHEREEKISPLEEWDSESFR